MVWTAVDFMTNQHNYSNAERLPCKVNLDFTLVVFFTGHSLLEPQSEISFFRLYSFLKDTPLLCN